MFNSTGTFSHIYNRSSGRRTLYVLYIVQDKHSADWFTAQHLTMGNSRVMHFDLSSILSFCLVDMALSTYSLHSISWGIGHIGVSDQMTVQYSVNRLVKPFLTPKSLDNTMAPACYQNNLESPEQPQCTNQSEEIIIIKCSPVVLYKAPFWVNHGKSTNMHTNATSDTLWHLILILLPTIVELSLCTVITIITGVFYNDQTKRAWGPRIIVCKHWVMYE